MKKEELLLFFTFAPLFSENIITMIWKVARSQWQASPKIRNLK